MEIVNKNSKQKKKLNLQNSLKCDNSFLLDSGSFGCVIRPPIIRALSERIKKNIKKTDVAKVFIKSEHYFSEMKKLESIKNIDPNNKFTISVKHSSVIVLNNTDKCNQKLKRCLKYKKDNIYYQIIMENAGTRIDLYEKKIKFNVFLNSFLNFIRGIEIINNNGYVYYDLKPRNTMIKKNKLNLIDFGMIRDIKDIYKDTNLKRLLFSYKYYPPECYIAYICLKHNITSDISNFLDDNISSIYTRHLSQYESFDQKIYFQQIQDFLKHIKDNRLKFDDVFNEHIASKIDVFGLYYILNVFYKNIIYKTNDDKYFISYLMKLCNNANPFDRISINELCQIVDIKLKQSKKSGK